MEVAYTQDFPISGNSHFMRIIWDGLGTGDTGQPFTLSQYADRSVQVVGTFGAGGAIVVEGSNDGTNFSTLTDPQGNSISISTAKIEAVSEIVVALQPRVSGGDGTTDLNVVMLVRRN